MKVTLSAVQVEYLRRSHAAFNKLTGSRWSFSKYINFVIDDAIAGETVAAERVAIVHKPKAAGAVNAVH